MPTNLGKNVEPADAKQIRHQRAQCILGADVAVESLVEQCSHFRVAFIFAGFVTQLAAHADDERFKAIAGDRDIQSNPVRAVALGVGIAGLAATGSPMHHGATPSASSMRSLRNDAKACISF